MGVASQACAMPQGLSLPRPEEIPAGPAVGVIGVQVRDEPAPKLDAAQLALAEFDAAPRFSMLRDPAPRCRAVPIRVNATLAAKLAGYALRISGALL